MLFLTAIQGLNMRLGKPRPVLRQVISHENNFLKAKEKGRPVGHPLRISSWLNAFDVGSPHAVLWTVCSLEAGSTLLGWRPQRA
ncbi:hypothetical protein CGU37_16915 [Pseudomonas fluorescens]|nr:hypothetical protein CGU36_17875 [Pseudomonas fluorescens]OZO47757.1 hypothetical protein CGU37_16915 [Pseudomonas fluorescens]PHN27462.1 hypothetical protein AO259_09335 [Pseudomonas sp. ICMP 564]POA60533.1 hypothetical protein C1885_07235 [Pseudomonas sp. GW531-R1]